MKPQRRWQWTSDPSAAQIGFGGCVLDRQGVFPAPASLIGFALIFLPAADFTLGQYRRIRRAILAARHAGRRQYVREGATEFLAMREQPAPITIGKRQRCLIPPGIRLTDRTGCRAVKPIPLTAKMQVQVMGVHNGTLGRIAFRASTAPILCQELYWALRLRCLFCKDSSRVKLVLDFIGLPCFQGASEWLSLPRDKYL